MKEGASDPFADDSEAQREEQTDEQSESAPERSGAEATDRTRTETATATEEARTGTEATADAGTVGTLPYIHARDTVKEDRPNVHQLFVRDDTDREAKRAEMELEDVLGEDVYRLDAREAIYLAGMQNLGDAAALLREWGYDWG